jgi:NADPH:quinone reductase
MSETVRAVGVAARGGLDELRVIEWQVREPGPGEVRIRVRAAAVNPTDIGLRERGVEGVDPPWVPGMDAAGVVESVGEGVERLVVGDAVMAAVLPRRPEGGAQAELVVVPAASVVRVPDGASLEEAATLPMNGLTALLGLELLGLEQGETLAVSGGAGLLASYAIPLARRRGLRVLVDAKQADETLVRSFGADEVLPRGDGFSRAVRELVPAGVDGLFDTALLGEGVFPAIRDGGAMALVRTWRGGQAERGIELRPVWVATALERTDWLEKLRRLASERALALRVAATYPPEEAAEAHRLMEAGGLRGRALIVF